MIIKNNKRLLHWPMFPLLRVLIFYIIGIVIANAYKIDHLILYAIPIILLLISNKLNSIHTIKIYVAKISSLLIFASTIFLGIINFNLHQSKNVNHHYSHYLQEDNSVIGRVLEDIKRKKSSSTTIQVVNINGHNSKGKVLIYFNKADSIIEYNPGDLVHFQGEIIPTLVNKNPHAFDYSRYLYHINIETQMFLRKEHHKLLKRDQLTFPHNITYNIRKWALSVFEENIENEEQLAIAQALVLGYKERISKDLYKAFSETGAVHVLAVSGLHVGIVCLIFFAILGLIKKDTPTIRWSKFAFLMFVIWSYTLITGASPAVTRAATMFSFILLGNNIKRNTTIFNSIAVSALLLLLYNPHYLFQPGFQLSYLALISIAFFQRKIFNAWLWPSSFLGLRIWRLVSVSLAAQILVFPISIYYFHKFPTVFILSSVPAVVLAFIILSGGLILLATSWIPYIGTGVAYLFCLILKCFIWIIYSIESIPGHSIGGIYLSFSAMMILYLFIASIMFLMKIRTTTLHEHLNPLTSKRKLGIYSCMFSIILFLGCHVYYEWRTRNNHQLIFYDISTSTFIDIFEGKNSYTIQSEPISEAQISFIAKDYRIYCGSTKPSMIDVGTPIKSKSFITDGKGQMIYKNTNLCFLYLYENKDSIPLNSDILIVSHHTKLFPYEILDNHNTCQVVIDASLSYETIARWKKECKKRYIPYHFIRQDGIFVI